MITHNHRVRRSATMSKVRSYNVELKNFIYFANYVGFTLQMHR